MTLFLLLGVLGLVMLAVSALADGALDLLGGEGLLSGPAIAVFVTAFGFGGALASYAGAAGPLAVAAGLAAGAGSGAATAAAVSAVSRMPTDATPATSDLAGRSGTVVTAVPADGFGEVSVPLGGQPVKLAARSAAGPLPAGRAVAVVAALSPTAVLVTPTPLPTKESSTP